MQCPPLLRLPPGTTVIEDADEEIFDLYTALNVSSHEGSSQGKDGLGFFDASSAILTLNFTIQAPSPSSTSPPEDQLSKKRRLPKRSRQQDAAVTVSAQVAQDTHALRHRKGDTGSVAWRASLLFSELLWHTHLFHDPFSFLDANLFVSSSKILELGAGTGCLAVLCRDLIGPGSKWTVSDQFDSLKLIQKTFTLNGIEEDVRFGIEEVDWVDVAERWQKQRSTSSKGNPDFDVIIGVDCLFNESLVLPFLRTIDHFSRPASPSSPSTLVIVVSELRSSEVMRLFIDEWLKLGGWKVVRVPPELLRKEAGLDMASSRYVVWCGCKVST